MTMSNVVMSSPQRTGASLRKTNKPLMEKRRRARINDSLSQLKSLVIQSNKKDSSQFNKLEKADILELTVKHLRNLQEQQQQLSQVNTDVNLAGKYQAGFVECANEVIHYLGQSQGFTDDLKSRVVHHLASCLQLSGKLPVALTNTSVASPPVLPAGHNNNNQLVSGQIVQVVSGQFANTKPAVASSFPADVTVSIAQRTSVSSAPTNIPATIATTTTTTPSSEPYNALKYTQPLRIQIPSVVSPIFIQAKTAQQPSNQSNVVYKFNDVAAQVVKVQALPSQVSTQMSSHKQETFMSSHPSTSPSRDRSLSPVPLTTCRNSHRFYTLDSQYSDFIPRSRTYSLTSSSSETEMSSPLNLSQSPQYYDHRELNSDYPNSFCKQIPQTSVHSNTISSTHPATKDRLLLPVSPSSKMTSVIVDGRKTAESHYMKYMHYIDEDQHFNSHQGSTSPASSVGEERLWRPW
ncbi:unnamed protein product [Candidula unifasciata]|uniref:Uncharacterized protein n=1 Tax=Candidula unifasciata TaxID=100452 RepID=A0A8S3Z2D4_9EUPU|nr:unnamed protein product [Candidula unifasciata]